MSAMSRKAMTALMLSNALAASMGQSCYGVPISRCENKPTPEELDRRDRANYEARLKAEEKRKRKAEKMKRDFEKMNRNKK